MILTIGYGNRQVDELTALLERYRCSVLVDVRSMPFSRYRPDYNRESLRVTLEKAGMRYVFMGDRLGGRPAAKEYYHSDGKANHDLLAEASFFRDGIRDLLMLSGSGGAESRKTEEPDPSGSAPVVVLLCSELVPEHCHRFRLIGTALQREGIDVRHIDADGRLLTQDEVTKRVTGGQGELFGV